MSLFIIRNIAKNNEWDASYLKAFYVVVGWGIISISLGSISNLLINEIIPWSAINTSGIFTTFLFIAYYSMQLLFYLMIIFVASLVVRKIYGGEFRESFKMLILFLIDQAILTFLFLPILPILSI
ncbi:MAG: hypothetical protein ACFE9Z_09925 [Promethearchaeota archaeon]